MVGVAIVLALARVFVLDVMIVLVAASTIIIASVVSTVTMIVMIAINACAINCSRCSCL